MKKVITSVLLVILIFEIVFANVSYGATDSINDKIGAGVADITEGVVGIPFYSFRIPFIVIAGVLESLLNGVASLDGSSMQGLVTPDDIIFNQVGLTNINFFDFTNGGSIVLEIRQNVATWYYALRSLAVAILLAVLVFIGIRLAITSVASERAKYMDMLKNWAVSFALIFVLHYLIVFIIQLNGSLVTLFYNAGSNMTYSGGFSLIDIHGNGYDDILKSLADQMFDPRVIESSTAILIFFLLIGMTFTFLVNYIKRFLTIGFLILISPLITITYSIDKMGDGKAQALNTWMKEFLLNVLIQPFHAVIYLAFSHAAISIATNSSDIASTSSALAALIFSLLTFKFMWDAEKIVKEIFGFKQASSLGDTVASLAAMTTVAKAIQGTAGKAGQVAGAAANTTFGKNLTKKIEKSSVGKWYKDTNKKIDDFIKNNRNSSNLLDNWKAEIASGTRDGLLKNPVSTAKAITENAGNAVIGSAAWAVAAGANDKNAINYGITAFDTAKAIRDGNDEVREKIEEQEGKTAKEANKYSEKTGLENDELKDKLNKLLDLGPDMMERILQSRLDEYVNAKGLDINDENYTDTLADLYSELEGKDLNDQSLDNVERSLLSAILDKNMADSIDKAKKKYKDNKYDDPKKTTQDLINDIIANNVPYDED